MHKKRMILFFMRQKQLTQSYLNRRRTFQIFRNLMKLLFQTILVVLFPQNRNT